MPGFLDRLRNESDAVKRRWIAVFSGGTMIVVIYAWVAYFDAFVIRQTPPVVASDVAVFAEDGDSFEARMRRGTARIGDYVEGLAAAVRGFFAEPKTYSISPGENVR